MYFLPFTSSLSYQRTEFFHLTIPPFHIESLLSICTHHSLVKASLGVQRFYSLPWNIELNSMIDYCWVPLFILLGPQRLSDLLLLPCMSPFVPEHTHSWFPVWDPVTLLFWGPKWSVNSFLSLTIFCSWSAIISFCLKQLIALHLRWCLYFIEKKILWYWQGNYLFSLGLGRAWERGYCVP